MNRPMLLRLARAALSLPTAPYHEQALCKFLLQQCQTLGLPVMIDRVGNIFVRYQHRHAGPPLVYVAHLDHPGFIALGHKRAEFLGSVPPALLKRARIRFWTAQGVVRAHGRRVQRSSWPRRKLLDLAGGRRLQRGDWGTWDFASFRLRGDRLEAVTIDDVLGAVVVLATLTDLVKKRISTHVWAVFTRAEEVGFGGAWLVATSRRIPRRAAIVSVEMSPARPWAQVGNGPVVRVGDRLTMFDPEVSHFLHHVAGRLNRPVQRALMDGGICEATAFAALGYKVGGLCLALGNYHNIGAGLRPRPEYVSVDDLLGLNKLLVAAADAWPRFDRIRQLHPRQAARMARDAVQRLRKQ